MENLITYGYANLKYPIYYFFTYIYSKGLYGRFLNIIPLEITYKPMYKTEMNDKPMVKIIK